MVMAMAFKKRVSSIFNIRLRALAAFLLFAAAARLLAPQPALAEGGDAGRAEEKPALDAKAAVLVDSESGEVIFEQEADTPLFIGGTAAVMTALLAFEAAARGEISLDDSVTADAGAYFDIPAEAIAGGKNTRGILVGETLSLRSLLYCALIGSSSEACNIIAAHVAGGDIGAFVGRMNERALELGCKNTHFANAHGLPYGGNQYSTARELAAIAREAVKYEEFMEICNSVSIEIAATNLSDTRLVSNDNYLIRPDYPRYYYSYACGIKSSGSETDGYNLVSSVDVDGKYVVSVVLGARMTEAENGYYDIQSFVQTKRLFKWFFDNYSYRDIVNPIEPLVEVPVSFGEGADSVAARAKTGLSMFLPNDLDIKSAFKRNITVYSMREGAEPLRAPVREGTILGEMTVAYGDRLFGPFYLVANADVEVSKFELMKDKAARIFLSPWIQLGFWGFVLIIGLYLVFVIRYNAARARRRRAMAENENAVTTIPRKKP